MIYEIYVICGKVRGKVFAYGFQMSSQEHDLAYIIKYRLGEFIRDKCRTLYLTAVDVRLGAPWDMIMREELRGYGPNVRNVKCEPWATCEI